VEPRVAVIPARGRVIARRAERPDLGIAQGRACSGVIP
jgi:hypothetical protein